MRRFERPPVPASFARRAASAMESLVALSVDERGKFIKKTAAVWRDFKAAYSQAQDGVCAYCEHDAAVSSHGDVEHFRPKGAVKNRADRSPTSRTEDPPPLDATATLDGYWWLSFEWSNYMFACQICNEVWKRDQFPLAVEIDRSAWGLSYDCAREAPLLLDPFDHDFDPQRHFRFVDDGGAWQIDGIDDRGNATIAACGLHRSELRTARNQRLMNVRERVLGVVDGLAKLSDLEGRERAMAWIQLEDAWKSLELMFDWTVSPSFAGDVRTFVEQLVRGELRRGVVALKSFIEHGAKDARIVLGVGGRASLR